jgi:hypothetical protein
VKELVPDCDPVLILRKGYRVLWPHKARTTGNWCVAAAKGGRQILVREYSGKNAKQHAREFVLAYGSPGWRGPEAR